MSGVAPAASSAAAIVSTASGAVRSQGDDQRPRPAGRCDLVGERFELVLAAGDEREIMAMAGENPREVRPDAARGAGDEGDPPRLGSSLLLRELLRPGPAQGRRARPLFRRLMAQPQPIMRRNPQELGDPRDDILLELMHAAIGEGDLPHHFDDLHAAVFIERTLERIGEMIEIDRLAVARFGGANETRRRLRVERESSAR